MNQAAGFVPDHIRASIEPIFRALSLKQEVVSHAVCVNEYFVVLAESKEGSGARLTSWLNVRCGLRDSDTGYHHKFDLVFNDSPLHFSTVLCCSSTPHLWSTIDKKVLWANLMHAGRLAISTQRFLSRLMPVYFTLMREYLRG
jgi:hypothetical protein